MTFRFWYQAIVGLLTIILVLLFGSKGGAALALFAFIPLIIRLMKVKKEWDERELQLFFKSNNYTLGFLIVFMVLINTFAEAAINGHSIGHHWLLLSVAGLGFIQGISGIIVFKIH